MQVVLSYYIQSPQWQSHSCSEQMVVMIAVVCFISVLYMTSDRKSRLFGSIASRILTSRNPFAITIWAVSQSDPRGGHESYDFVFTGLVLTVTFGSVYHRCLLDIHIQRLSLLKGLHNRKNRLRRAYFGGFCYEVFPTLSSV